MREVSVENTKEIHFFEYGEDDAIPDWNSTDVALDLGLPVIRTLQMGLLSADLWTKGYRIFIHESPVSSYELKPGGDNDRTDRELRIAHNLFKLWRAGSFRK